MLASAKEKARCDYAQFLGAEPNNADWDAHLDLPLRAAGLKMYLDSIFGELRLEDMTLWMQHIANFSKHLPIVLHPESRKMAAGIQLAEK